MGPLSLVNHMISVKYAGDLCYSIYFIVPTDFSLQFSHLRKSSPSRVLLHQLYHLVKYMSPTVQLHLLYSFGHIWWWFYRQGFGHNQWGVFHYGLIYCYRGGGEQQYLRQQQIFDQFPPKKIYLWREIVKWDIERGMNVHM